MYHLIIPLRRGQGEVLMFISLRSGQGEVNIFYHYPPLEGAEKFNICHFMFIPLRSGQGEVLIT